MNTAKEWAAETKKQPGGFAALPQHVGDDKKKTKAASESGQPLLSLIGQLQPPVPAALKFAFNQMVTPAIRGAGMPAFSGITTAPKIPQVTPPKPPAVPQPQMPKPRTLGGNTPTMNPIGLLGQLTAAPGQVSGNASFSGAKM